MKKQNKRLVAQPKGEGKCHSLTPNANSATVAPRARVGDASIECNNISTTTTTLHLAHAWEMRQRANRPPNVGAIVAPRARVGDASRDA